MNGKLEEFLSLQSFDEYMEKYEWFCGLPMGKHTFRKEMQLMEGDSSYTHREKDTIRERRKRKVLKKLHHRIEELRKETVTDGVWITPMSTEGEVVIPYQYPNDKKGDIIHFLSGKFHEPEKTGENAYLARIPVKAYETIELLILPVKNLFKEYDYDHPDEAVAFLLKFHRIAQIEYLMNQVNYYHEEYRSLRSIPDLALKRLLQDYHRKLNLKKDRIYEELIRQGKTNPRWISEQKAYIIVKNHYPDAKFQYQPDFLFGQRLDIYIPSKKTAIEYQGKQHYEPVEFFGGKAGFENNQERDHRKRWRCEANGVRILYWDYDQPLTEEYFVNDLKQKVEQYSEGNL